MLNRKKMAKISEESEDQIFTKASDIYDIIKIHSHLGYSEIDIFVSKKIIAKVHSFLDGKGYYCRSYDFQCLPNEARLYVAWR
jgi:hypothetical protein